VDGHTRTTPAVRDATPSLQLCTVLSAAMRGDRGDACRWLGGLRDGRLPRLHPLLRGSRKDELPRQVPRRHGARRAAIPAPHRRRSGRRSIFIPAAVKRGEPFFGTAVARQQCPSRGRWSSTRRWRPRVSAARRSSRGRRRRPTAPSTRRAARSGVT